MADTPQGTGNDTPADQADTDWEKRYRDLQSEYTRETQRRSQIEDALRDPDETKRLLSDYGYEFDVDEDDNTSTAYEDDEMLDDDQADYYAPRLRRLEAYIEQLEAEKDEAAQAVKEDAYITEKLLEIQEPGRELSENAMQLIGDVSLQMRDDRGRPDVQGAYERIYKDVLESERDNWVKSKRAPRVGSGGAGSQEPNWDDPEERIRAINEVAEDMDFG